MKASQFGQKDLLPPWSAFFPEQLAEFAEREILDSRGLTLRTYSTKDFLALHPETLSFNKVVGRTWSERVEVLSPHISSRFEQLGLRFSTSSGALLADTMNVFRYVDHLLERESGLRTSVEFLVKAIHIIESKGPDYDCSFSDPAIPLSIFISIPEPSGKNRELRVLEAVVHECMHLQLSVFELQMPIMRTKQSGATCYSPWKRSRRKVQGVLHGMYVFHVVAYLYSVLMDSGVLKGSDKTFVQHRLSEIASELVEVRGVEQSLDLSPIGVGLARAILNLSPVGSAHGAFSTLQR